MTMRLQVLAVIGLAVACILAGCSQGSSQVGSTLKTEFKDADPALKAKVEFAVAAFTTNNYVGVIATLREISSSKSITSQQQKAIEGMLEVVSTKMSEGIDKGDTNAIMARDILQQLRRPGR